MNGRLELRIIIQPHSEVYCGYFSRLVFGNSLTKHNKLSSFAYSEVIFSYRFPTYRLVIMLNLSISHVCLSPVHALRFRKILHPTMIEYIIIWIPHNHTLKVYGLDIIDSCVLVTELMLIKYICYNSTLIKRYHGNNKQQDFHTQEHMVSVD